MLSLQSDLLMMQVARVRKPNVKDPEALRKVEVLTSLQLGGLVMVRCAAVQLCWTIGRSGRLLEPPRPLQIQP